MVKELEVTTVTLYETSRVDNMREICDDFMYKIFELSPGDYLLTDRSSVSDFTCLDFVSLENEELKSNQEYIEIWHKIEDEYGIKQKELESDTLADIFEEIKLRQTKN